MQPDLPFPPPGPASIGSKKIKTEIEYGSTHNILTKPSGFMDAYDYTLNPYSGCSFGCTYCYAAFFSRSTEKRDSWGRWVLVKQNAAARLRDRRTDLKDKRIYMSTVTDPYQPIERDVHITRQLLEILADCQPKLVVQTRSPNVVRDIDLFKRIVNNGGRVQVNLTVTTDDDDVRRTFEPHCPNNNVRLRAAAKLREANVQTCITMTPLLWVADANGFADQLLDTKVKRFIVQGFHFQKGKFVRGTRDAALYLMAQKFDMTQTFANDRKEHVVKAVIKDLIKRYGEHYDSAHEVLRARIEHAGLPPLGEGKDGFRPPF